MSKLRRLFRLRNIVGLLIVAGAAIGWRFAFQSAVPVAETGSKEHTVATATIEDLLLVNGLVKPAVTIDLRAEASGLVEAVFVKDGDRVKAGQELIRLDSRVAHTAVQEADANLKQAEMQQAAAEIDLDEDTLALRRKTRDRTKELLAKGLVASSELETRELEVRVSERALERARRNMDTNRARIEQLKAAVERAQAQLQHTIVRSPLDAWVIRRHVEVGSGVAGVAQSSTGGTIVVTLGDARQASLQAKVTAADARRLKTGLATRLKLDTEPDKVRNGRVQSVAAAGEQDTATRLTTFPVIIEVEVDPNSSWINIPAQAEIVIGQRPEVLVVPDGCLRTTPGGQPQAFIKSGSGPPTSVTVELGTVEKDRVEVKKGLTAGQVILCR
ncbi:MAG: efflux RND transporter periplasmic adaptor subunit [Acidobacteria bacterium]|jgi:HlyD family secretion protein|nr:efflux RND transporter periplasmic adaptor subunit [Acidobacteriota bacterium]